MNDRDGLFIEGVRVADADTVATNYVGNDLTKPATLQSSHSESFELPDNRLVRKLTANAEQLDSGSRFPYIPLSARVVNDGESVFDGIAELDSFSAGWEVALYEEKRALFDRLDRSIKTVNLDYLNHLWTLEEINLRSEAVEGLCYPLIDYGLLRDGVLPLDTIFPAVFVKTLIAAMLLEEGYSLVGDLPADELYKRLIIPFTESEPTSYDEQWQADRFACVTLELPPDTIDKGTLGAGYFVDRIQPFNRDNIDTFSQGKLHNYNTSSYSYVCDTAMNLKVECTQFFRALCLTGGIEVMLTVEKNGQRLADNARFEAGGGYNILFLRTDTLNLTQTVTCKKGDRIQIRLEARRFTKTGAYRFEIYNDPDNAFVSFTPSLTTSTGDLWKVSRNLPELTGVQLLVAIAQVFGGTWLVNKRRRQVSFSKLSDIIANTANAIDWSNRLNTGTEPKWVPRIDPYGQNNRLTWKETDETKKAGSLLGGSKLLNFGDGIILVDAPVLETEVTLFELPFAASTNSEQNLPGYGNPVLLKTRTVSGRGDNLTISNQATIARLLLVTPGDPTGEADESSVAVNSSRIADDGVTVEPVVLKLRPCWFGVRPDVALSSDTRFCLSFNPMLINKGEQCLIERNYEGLKRVLRRMRVLTVSMRLKPADIAGLDFRKPIRLQRVAVGTSLILSNSYYYLNKITGYSSHNTCQVTLISF